MKFSIVIPAFNEALWIDKTLTAVINQSYRNFEVIIVNNNSKDNTEEVVHSFIQKDSRIRLVSCPTQGLLHARNYGLHEAKGEIIVQLDADNIPGKHWLRNGLKHFQQQGVVALGGFYYYYDANIFFRYGSLIFQFLSLPIANWYVQKRKFGAFMIGGDAFIKKWVLEDMGGYDTTHTFCSEDLVTAREVAKRGWVKCCLDITVKSSARRHIALGYNNVQRKYNMGTAAVLQGKPIPRQPEEYDFPR